jgi:voltage-gated potassium channel Kch
LESSDGGSNKSLKWRKKKGGGNGAYFGAFLFVGLIGSMPVALASFAQRLTRTQVLESVVLYIWLIGGLYLFTNVLIFQSPHFHEPRTLSMEEAVYLYAQILTTVGYGDITPARPRGQLFVGLFVLIALLLIAGMIQEMMEIFEDLMENRIERLSREASQTLKPGTSLAKRETKVLREAFAPVIYTSLVFCCFVAFGTLFFSFYPGEDKTVAQAVYMSLITLSTVGFGAFTPSTHAGMVVGAFWMLFGTASLVSVVTSRATFSIALKKHELDLDLDAGSCHDVLDKSVPEKEL